RPDGPAEQRLVDVDEADAPFGQPRVELRLVPALVPHLDDERVLAERLHQVREPLAARVVVLERPGELDQHGAELARLVQRVEAIAHAADLAERPRLLALVREAAPQLGGVVEVVQVAHPRGPLLCDLAPRGPVERRVDLDQVDVAGEVTDRVEAARLRLRVDDAVPVGVVPAGDAHADRAHAGRGHGAVLLRFGRSSREDRAGWRGAGFALPLTHPAPRSPRPAPRARAAAR